MQFTPGVWAGDPADALIASAADVGAQMIVVGNKGMLGRAVCSDPSKIASRITQPVACSSCIPADALPANRPATREGQLDKPGSPIHQTVLGMPSSARMRPHCTSFDPCLVTAPAYLGVRLTVLGGQPCPRAQRLGALREPGDVADLGHHDGGDGAASSPGMAWMAR